ncbi:MAG: ferritin [Candidatus Sumerlaeota bacterium]|nr:ferritin [Candidatus Sumerlaeota bacterium]
MISKTMQDALNDQINAELFSWYLYLSMAAQFETMNWKGMAKWMRIQAGEEMKHATKIYDFLFDRNGQVKLAALKGPKTSWASPLEAFSEALEHERMITSRIHALVEKAMKEKDFASLAFLQWFVAEQVEEENSATYVVDRLKLIKDSPGGLGYFDHELGKRGE